MSKFNEQAQRNVLKSLINLMSEQMAKGKQAPSDDSDLVSPDEVGKLEELVGLAASNDEEDDECPHCDGKGCRFCE